MGVELRCSIAINRASSIVLKRCSDEFSGRLRCMNIADARLCIAFQFSQRYANTFAMRFAHMLITTHKPSERNGLRRRECRIPSCAMLCACDLLAIFVFVGSGRLMFDKLCGIVRMLSFTQSCKVVISHTTLQTPFTRQPSLPLAVALLVAAPVILFFRSELARVIRAGLACGQCFGDSQHMLQLCYRSGSI